MEIQFQKRKERTAAIEGSHPRWNETLLFPIFPEGSKIQAVDFETLHQTLYVNIFDDFTVDLLRDERDRSRKVHQRSERVWLGAVRIPFQTIYRQISVGDTAAPHHS